MHGSRQCRKHCPGGGDRLVSEQKTFGQKTASMAQAVEEAAQAEETGLEEKNRPELRKLTDDLKRDLAQSRTPEDPVSRQQPLLLFSHILYIFVN